MIGCVRQQHTHELWPVRLRFACEKTIRQFWKLFNFKKNKLTNHFILRIRTRVSSFFWYFIRIYFMLDVIFIGAIGDFRWIHHHLFVKSINKCLLHVGLPLFLFIFFLRLEGFFSWYNHIETETYNSIILLSACIFSNMTNIAKIKQTCVAITNFFHHLVIIFNTNIFQWLFLPLLMKIDKK